MTRKLVPLFAAAALWATPLAAWAADKFVDFDPSKGNQASQAPLFVIISYSLIWVVLVLFTFVLWRQQSAVRQELERAQARLDELEGSQSTSPRGAGGAR